MPKQSTSLLVVVIASVLAGCATDVTRKASAPEEADTRLQPAFEHMRNREFAKAEAVLLEMSARTPDDALVLTNLGIVYAHMQRLDDSAASLQRAIEISPRNAVAWNELGITHRRAGRFEEAEAAYRKAIEVRPDYAFAHYNLGVLLDLYLQRRDQAIAHYEQYLALDNPHDKQVQAWVKDLQRRTGQGPSTAAAGAEVERR